MTEKLLHCPQHGSQLSRKCLAVNLVSAAEICRRKGVKPSTVNSWIKRFPDWPTPIVPPNPANGIGGIWWWPEITDFLDKHQLPNQAMIQAAAARLPTIGVFDL